MQEPPSPPLARQRVPPGVGWGAAFLMATSAIGPGFLTQTAVFTASQRADFAFTILLSVLLAAVVQANVWRVLGASGRRAPELASSLLPGLGGALALVVFAGGLVFNVGNVAGCGLGLAVFGVPERAGAALSAVAVVAIVGSARAGAAMDRVSRVLGAAMILLTAAVAIASRPPLLDALRGAVAPARLETLPVLTLLGGTVGGYIPFSGVHRLLDAGVRGRGAVPGLTRFALLGVAATAAMRALLFLAVLGVVSGGGVLDPANPPASAFRLGAGAWGERLFGLVLWSAALTSVVGCTYTSLSFVEGLWTAVRRQRVAAVACFVAVSLALFAAVDRPVRLLILAGALNALVLPVTLSVTLVAARRSERLDGYRHPRWLSLAGWAALLVAAATALLSLGELRSL